MRTGCAHGLFVVALAALGCAAAPAPRDHFYRLEASAPEQALAKSPFPGTLVVDLFRADALTGERLLLYRDGGSAEVQRYPYHHWVDTPTRMVQLQLVHYLRASGAARRVVTPDVRVDANYKMTGRILQLERVVGDGEPRVRVELEIGVVRLPRRKLVMLETFFVEEAAAGEDVEASVLAMNRALTRIFADFLTRAAT